MDFYEEFWCFYDICQVIIFSSQHFPSRARSSYNIIININKKERKTFSL